MPIDIGRPTGTNMIEAQAVANVNCMTPEYMPATTEPVVVEANCTAPELVPAMIESAVVGAGSSEA
jgi:hypothetical protein